VIGLVGAVAGVLIAFGGQYPMRRAERQERCDALLLEQFAQVIALSEDYRNRVREERKQVASDVVDQWIFAAYRLAEARLRVSSQDPLVNPAECGSGGLHPWSGARTGVPTEKAPHNPASILGRIPPSKDLHHDVWLDLSLRSLLGSVPGL
jgi:hypothetical protein